MSSPSGHAVRECTEGTLRHQFILRQGLEASALPGLNSSRRLWDLGILDFCLDLPSPFGTDFPFNTDPPLRGDSSLATDSPGWRWNPASTGAPEN